jgi:hypothetical protein
MNGTIVRLTYKGTYTVKPDCSGTVTFTNSQGQVSNYDIFRHAERQELYLRADRRIGDQRRLGAPAVERTVFRVAAALVAAPHRRPRWLVRTQIRRLVQSDLPRAAVGRGDKPRGYTAAEGARSMLLGTPRRA